MSEVSTKQQGQEQKTTLPGKGRRLCLAREQKGLSIQDVADRLKFEPRFIQALEDDDYDRLPGPAYIYGYLRAYAKLLGLPADELLSGLPSQGSESELLAENVDYRGPVAKQRRPLWIGLGVFLVLALLGIGVWLAYDSEWSPMTQTSGSKLATQTASALIETPASATNDAKVTPAVAKDATVSIVEDDTRDNTKDAVNNEEQSKLMLEYKTDSWTDIRDGEGRRLVYRLVEEGSRLELNANPPFSVLLGYSPGVVIEYNNTPFNHSSYERKNIAYFVVGEDKEHEEAEATQAFPN